MTVRLPPGQQPTAADFIQAFLTSFRAPARSRTISTPHQTMEVREDTGRRTLYAPDGKSFLVEEDTGSGVTHITEDDCRHAVVRPKPARASVTEDQWHRLVDNITKKGTLRGQA